MGTSGRLRAALRGRRQHRYHTELDPATGLAFEDANTTRAMEDRTPEWQVGVHGDVSLAKYLSSAGEERDSSGGPDWTSAGRDSVGSNTDAGAYVEIGDVASAADGAAALGNVRAAANAAPLGSFRSRLAGLRMRAKRLEQAATQRDAHADRIAIEA